jgi:hypothetical protein
MMPDKSVAPNPVQIDYLANAAWQVLCNMGKSGLTMSKISKAELREALEPFMTGTRGRIGLSMTLEDAQSTMEDDDVS